MILALLSIVIIAILMTGMSVGYILQGRCLRGSCGGPEVLGPNGESLACATCPLKKLRENADQDDQD